MADNPLDAYPAYMSPVQVAELLGLDVETLSGWRKTGRGPAYVKLGDAAKAPVRYPRENLRKYLSQRTVTPNSPALLPYSSGE